MTVAIAYLDGPRLRRAFVAAAQWVAAGREALNRINVFPVPDGDTGTNMALTLESVVTELDGAAADMAATCKAISHGSLMGARGNSGVILSQVLRGIAGVYAEVAAQDEGDVGTLSRALTAASEAAYQAVMKPVEGTILTVIREAAEAATAAVAVDEQAEALKQAFGGRSVLLVIDDCWEEDHRDRMGQTIRRVQDLIMMLVDINH